MLEVLQIGKQDIPETLPSILEHLTELQEESSTPIPMTDVERGKITRKVSVKDDDDKGDVVRVTSPFTCQHSSSMPSSNITVIIPPRHPKYYLPGGDLHVIVGAT